MVVNSEQLYEMDARLRLKPLLEEKMAKLCKWEEAEDKKSLYKKIPVLLKRLDGYSGALALYFHMRGNVSTSTWANLDTYYAKGYLPFAKHQGFIARDFDVSQPAISKWLKKLVKAKMIEVIGNEIVSRGKDQMSIIVYSLGTWEDVGYNNSPDWEKDWVTTGVSTYYTDEM